MGTSTVSWVSAAAAPADGGLYELSPLYMSANGCPGKRGKMKDR
jgi:hypothetical protein